MPTDPADTLDLHRPDPDLPIPVDPVSTLPRLRVDPGEGGVPDLVLRELLGVGGHSAVYRAWQPHLGRHVAVKVAREDEEPVVEGSLIEEARWASRVDHPNVLPVYQIGRDDNDHVLIVLREVHGRSLHEALTQNPPTNLDDWRYYVGVLVAVGNALRAAHDVGVIHGDVKARNVMLGRKGEIYLVDWGVARPLGETSAMIRGTPGHLAPEMALGQPVDARSDVFLLGATLHFALTGRSRNEGADVASVIQAATRALPFAYSPEVPSGLGRIANRACAQDPLDRYPDMAAMVEALEEWSRASLVEGLLSAALAQLKAAGKPSTSDHEAQVARRTALLQARFAYEQAWATVPLEEARDGIARTTERLVEVELDDLDPVSARAWLGRHPNPPPGWSLSVDARIRDVENRLAEKRRHEALGRDADLSTAPRPAPTLITAVTLAIGAAVGLVVAVRTFGILGDLAIRRLVVFEFALILYFPIRMALGQGKGRRNVAVRWGVDSLVFLLFADRVLLGWWLQGPPEWMLVLECYTLAGWVAGLRHLFRAAPWLAAWLCVTGFLIVRFPASEQILFNGSFVVTLGILAVEAWLRERMTPVEA